MHGCCCPGSLCHQVIESYGKKNMQDKPVLVYPKKWFFNACFISISKMLNILCFLKKRISPACVNVIRGMLCEACSLSHLRRKYQSDWNIITRKQIVLHRHSRRVDPGLCLGMCPANERRCYNVTTSPVGWATPFQILTFFVKSTCWDGLGFLLGPMGCVFFVRLIFLLPTWAFEMWWLRMASPPLYAKKIIFRIESYAIARMKGLVKLNFY